MSIASAADEAALVSLTGLGEDGIPAIENQLHSNGTVTLAAPSDSTAEFDVANTGEFVPSPVSFSLPAGGSEVWTVSADTDPLPVEILVDIGGTTVELTRDVVVSDGGQFDVIVEVEAAGASGGLGFVASNEGSRDATVSGIRVDDTTTNSVEVAQGDIFELAESEYGPEDPRQLVSDPLDVGAIPISSFDDGDTVVIPQTGEELEFEFDRFRNPPGPGSPNTDLRGETVWITLAFADGSQRQYQLDDS